jgi:hypothetical protein
VFPIVRFSQNDPRWKDRQLGADPDLTLGSHGCLVADLAMAAAGFGFNVTPLSLNERLMGLGANIGFQGGLVIPSSLPRALPGLVFQRYVSARSSPAPVAEIRTTLLNALPVIVEVDYSPVSGLQNHWLVLYGTSGDDFLFQDPFPYPPETGQSTLLNSRYAFAGGLGMIITAAIWLEGPRPAVNKPPGALSVFTTADQLALRSQPFTDPNNLIKRYPYQTELFSLEETDLALRKLGMLDQWLRVQDSGGVQGYAAAWYLQVQPQTVPIQPPAGEALRVYAAADALALRSYPTVGPDNLVKRLALGAELAVVDDTSTALAKIGVVGAWLKVIDSTGQAGYVAAWYVSTQPQVPLGVGSPPGGASDSNLVVRVTAPQLALRSQPRIDPLTLLKRLEEGTQLLVMEPTALAEAKIGVPGQWLPVRDSSGQAGFVAAWYVSRL